MDVTPRYKFRSMPDVERLVVEAIVRVEWDSREPRGERVAHCFDAAGTELVAVPVNEPMEPGYICRVYFQSDDWEASMEGKDRA